MKKDYSSLFYHYYGLQYDNNVAAMIKVHELMEKAEIVPVGSTSNKLDRYSDKRPFKVHYFISKVGKTLKWCPTSSQEKLDKMTLKPAEWWIEQLSDEVVLSIPANWLDEQSKSVKDVMLRSQIRVINKAINSKENTLEDLYEALHGESVTSVTTSSTDDDYDLPF